MRQPSRKKNNPRHQYVARKLKKQAIELTPTVQKNSALKAAKPDEWHIPLSKSDELQEQLDQIKLHVQGPIPWSTNAKERFVLHSLHIDKK